MSTNLEEILKRLQPAHYGVALEDVRREFERLIEERDAREGLINALSDSNSKVIHMLDAAKAERSALAAQFESFRLNASHADKIVRDDLIAERDAARQSERETADQRDMELSARRAAEQRAEAAQDREKKLREALEKIRRTPTMPFPDRGAHSKVAFTIAVWTAWLRIQQIANAALALEPPKDVTEADQ